MWLFALVLVVPLIEIALFVQIGGWLTLWPTLAVVVFSAALGVWLLRRQGEAVMSELRRSVGRAGASGRPIAHGALRVLAAILLIAPGFLTDALGLLLLVPPVRSLLLRALVYWLGVRVVAGAHAAEGRRQAHGQALVDLSPQAQQAVALRKREGGILRLHGGALAGAPVRAPGLCNVVQRLDVMTKTCTTRCYRIALFSGCHVQTSLPGSRFP